MRKCKLDATASSASRTYACTSQCCRTWQQQNGTWGLFWRGVSRSLTGGGVCLKIGNTNPKKQDGDGLALLPFCNIQWFARPSHRSNPCGACESPRARGAAAAIDLPWRRRRVIQHTPKNSILTHCTVWVLYCRVREGTGLLITVMPLVCTNAPTRARIAGKHFTHIRIHFRTSTQMQKVEFTVCV